jgi:hypothetical protein
MEAMKKGSCNLIEIIDIRLNHFRRRAEQTQFRPILLSALCFQAARRRKLPRSQPDPWFRVSPQGVQSTRALQPPVKYRRFTGRGCALNAGKAIEIAKKKARAPNRPITGAETGK